VHTIGEYRLEISQEIYNGDGTGIALEIKSNMVWKVIIVLLTKLFSYLCETLVAM